MIDIDDFKRLNDRLGHAAGDEILARIAQILNGAVRGSDLCARYGGEEFVILAPGTDTPGAYALAEKVRTAIAESSFIVDDSLRPLRVHRVGRRRGVRGQPQALLPEGRPGALPRQGRRQELRGRPRGRHAGGRAPGLSLRAMSVVIGLSGGIGSGKSTVSRMFAALGATVIDADAIVHELQAPGMPMVDELAAEFGPGILSAPGVLDRKALGAIVFENEAARLRLNQIVHPQVGAEFARRLAAAIASKAPLVVLDIPLLFEGRVSGKGSAASRNVQTTVVVWVPEAGADRAHRSRATAALAKRRSRACAPSCRSTASASSRIT